MSNSFSEQENRWRLLIIFLTVFVDMIGFGIVIPVLPLYAQHFNAEFWQIGLLFGSFSLMQLIFAPVLGQWSDRFGRRPVLFFSILGTALSFTLMGLAKTLWVLFLARMLDGLTGANVTAAQAYIADVTPPEKRSASMGLLGAAFGLGFVVGPAIGGLLGQYGMTLPFFAAAGLAFFNTVAILLFLPESLPQEKRGASQKKTHSIWTTLQSIRKTPVITVFACTLLSTIAFSLVTAMFTLFSQNRLQWGARENGFLFAGIGIIGVIIQGGLLRRLIPKISERTLILTGCLLIGCSMVILPLDLPFAPYLPVFAGSALLATGNSFVTPLLSGLTSKLTNVDSQGRVLGLLQSVSSFSRLMGPALGGMLLSVDARVVSMPFGTIAFGFSAVLMGFAWAAARMLPKSV
ncbi:MAG: MFS transporter [Cyanobacteria bacterium P01_H01_bin.74]